MTYRAVVLSGRGGLHIIIPSDKIFTQIAVSLIEGKVLSFHSLNQTDYLITYPFYLFIYSLFPL